MLDLVGQGAKSRAVQQDGDFDCDSCPKKSGKAKKKKKSMTLPFVKSHCGSRGADEVWSQAVVLGGVSHALGH